MALIRPILAVALAVPLVSAGASRAQFMEQADDPARLPATPQPRLVADIDACDFGRLFDTEVVQRRIGFTNRGKAPLTITSIRGSCTCTKPSLDDPDRREYAPGEGGSITVVFDPTGRRGDQHTNVIITTNNPRQSSVLIPVTAHVVPVVSVRPRLAHVGTVEKDRGGELMLKVWGAKPDFEVLGARVVGEHFAVALLDPEDEEIEGEVVRVTPVLVELLPGAPIGKVEGSQLVLETNDERKPAVELPITAQHRGDVEVWPRTAYLGAVKAGERFRREVTLTSRSDRPFSLEPLDRWSIPSGIDVEVRPIESEDAGAGWKVILSGAVPEDGTTYKETMEIATGVDREERIVFNISAMIRPKASAEGGAQIGDAGGAP